MESKATRRRTSVEDGGGEGIGFGRGSGRAGAERRGAARRGYARVGGCRSGENAGSLGRRGRAVEGEDELITDHAACQG